MSKGLIFITGATGFIGAHVVTQSLAAGYKIRLSVRKESQIEGLRKLFSEHAENVDFTVIPNFTDPGAFDEALGGVSYIFHVASPMPGKGDDFETDYLKPAVEGTTALLDVAKKIDTIKRVVIVSSVLSLIPLGALATGKFTAKEGLNPTIVVDPKMSFPEDPMSSGGLKYHASKVLAHRATLDWASTNNPHFNIITIHPSFVFGRNLTQTSPGGIDGTNAMLWGTLHSPKPFIPMNAVDVRDVAAAHIKALDVKTGSTSEVEEFITSAGTKEGWTWEAVTDFVKEQYPALDVKLEGPFEEPPSVDTTKAQKVLGMQWKSMQETIRNFLDQQVELKSQL